MNVGPMFKCPVRLRESPVKFLTVDIYGSSTGNLVHCPWKIDPIIDYLKGVTATDEEMDALMSLVPELWSAQEYDRVIELDNIVRQKADHRNLRIQ